MDQGCLSIKDMQLLKKIGITTFYFTDVDYAINRIRKKYNVVIYPSMPFINYSGKIVYKFTAKYYNPKMGCDNGTFIDTPDKWDSNIYEAKRRAIRAAAQWILAHRCKKVSIKQRRNEASKKRKN